MATMKIIWLPGSKAAFETFKRRAISVGKYQEFATAHNNVVAVLRDAESAFEKGELLFKTRKPGGEVRHYVIGHISVCYAAYRIENAGWILGYHVVPEEWLSATD